MSLANIKKVHQQCFPQQSPQLQWAALKMEMNKTEQLRKQLEDVERKNVEKLTALLSNVDKFKKRTNNPLFKGHAALGGFMNNHPLGFVVLFGGLMAAGAVGMVAGYMVEPQLQLISAIGGATGVLGAGSVGILCMSTAEKYKETTRCAVHRELFELLPKLSSKPHSQLNTCMQQLYNLGADRKIPGPFWKECVTLLRQIQLASHNLQLQQKHLEQQIEKMTERDPQADQAFENLKSFAQRHQKFVEVNVEPTQDIQEESSRGDNVKKASANAIKI